MLKHAARSVKKEIKQPNTPTKMHKPARTAAFAFLYTELNTAGCTQLHEDVLTWNIWQFNLQFRFTSHNWKLHRLFEAVGKADESVAIREAVALQEAKQRHKRNKIACRKIRQQITDFWATSNPTDFATCYRLKIIYHIQRDFLYLSHG